MPRGVPKNGYRVSKSRQAAGEVKVYDRKNTKEIEKDVHVDLESYEEAELRIREAFEILSEMGRMAIDGDCRSLIISGPPGLGKSFKIHDMVEKSEAASTIMKGYCKATGLYRLLYKNRHPGSVIVFDDCDAVLFDETALNFLKSACDTTPVRQISYGAEFDMFDEDEGEVIPRSFAFEGSIIFITNIDFDGEIEKNRNKLVPHWSAMVSRSHYIDLGIKTKRDCLIRIKHVVEDGCLDDMGLTAQEKNDVVAFVNDNSDYLRELSVRILVKVANIRSAKSSNLHWERIAKATCCRQARRQAA